MKRQLKGLALILVGIQLTLVWLANPFFLSGDVGPLLNEVPALASSAAGLFLCFRRESVEGK